MSVCKGCGAKIIWIETARRKKIPCNPEQVYYYERNGAKERIVTPNGEVLCCSLRPPHKKAEPTGFGHIPHWATCPHAKDFKKKRKNA